MIFQLGQYLQQFWGPARLLSSYAVLIAIALYTGFFAAYKLIPKFFDKLPHDRGREFTLKENAEAAKGKPTGAGIVFITIFVILCFLLVPMNWMRASIIILTWLTMLTGYLDDHSANKTEIKLAVERIFQVKVEDVRVSNVRAKSTTRGTRYSGKISGYKKAVITIAEGEAIDLFKE